jgi:iron complex transport system ATP-binding protein
MTPLLEARGAAVQGRLEPTDLNVQAGEVVAIIGPNGAGKTSLLRALAGIELRKGFVTIDGETVVTAPPSRRMRLLGFLPATRSLVWPISARDVIALGLAKPDEARIGEIIDLLELQAFADRPVNSLSTGERSRVLFARALAARPRVLLLDEPLSNLDPYWVLRTLEILGQAVAATNCAVLASLHNLEQMRAFSRALLVNGGRVIADESPDEMLASETLGQAFRIKKNGPAWQIRTTTQS